MTYNRKGPRCGSWRRVGTEAQNSGTDAKDIDLVIVTTSTPDDLFGDAGAIAASIGATNAAVSISQQHAMALFTAWLLPRNS